MRPARYNLHNSIPKPIHIRRRGPTTGCAIAQLTMAIVAPAFHVARVEQRAGMKVARREGDCAQTKSADGYRCRTVGAAAVTQLPLAVRPPTLHTTGKRNRARVVIAGGQPRACRAALHNKICKMIE